MTANHRPKRILPFRKSVNITFGLPKAFFVVYIPCNFEPHTFLKENPGDFSRFTNKVDEHADNLAYILGLIYSIPAIDKDFDLRKRNGFIPINAQTLQRSGIRDNHEYLNYLKENKVLEFDDLVIAGEKSKGYRLLSPYEEADLITYGISKVTLVKKHLKGLIDDESVAKYPQLFEFLKNVKVDEEAALKKAEEIAYKKPIPKKKRVKEKSDQEIRDMINLYYQISIKYINSGVWKFKIPDFFTGRLYTNVVNLKRELRSYLTYGEENLIAIDLKNSQPYLLLSIFKPYNQIGPITKEVLTSINPDAYSKVKTILEEADNPSTEVYKEDQWENTIMLAKKNTDFKDDLRLYSQIVTAGKYYEYLMKAFKILENRETEPKRDSIKRQTLTFMYGKDEKVNTFSRYKLFKKLFPTISQVYSALKVDNYKNFPKFLQTLESRLFLDTAYKQISTEKPTVPILTIHDSLVTTEGNEDYVEQVLSEVLENEIGEKPVLKMELWQPKAN